MAKGKDIEKKMSNAQIRAIFAIGDKEEQERAKRRRRVLVGDKGLKDSVNRMPFESEEEFKSLGDAVNAGVKEGSK